MVPYPLLSQGLFSATVATSERPKETALSMPCGQDAWQRQEKAHPELVSMGLGELVEPGPPRPGDTRPGEKDDLPTACSQVAISSISSSQGETHKALPSRQACFQLLRKSCSFSPANLYACICVYVCGNAWACVHVHLYMWRPEDDLRNSIHSRETGSLTG